ncbi:MAG TPA: energy-coupling factor ABC transporter ATP-binding protein, partial [Lysinibacillus sp.]|nr:energy-coupling factor ABC transporter ATP-binding protein [Lysinibacillus sp.]
DMFMTLQKKKLLQENITPPRSKYELQQLIEQL